MPTTLPTPSDVFKTRKKHGNPYVVFCTLHPCMRLSIHIAEATHSAIWFGELTKKTHVSKLMKVSASSAAVRAFINLCHLFLPSTYMHTYIQRCTCMYFSHECYWIVFIVHTHPSHVLLYMRMHSIRLTSQSLPSALLLLRNCITAATQRVGVAMRD